ncbi:hypothetical protein Dimus_035285, partial [Dionaea muscipula]
MRNSQPIMKLSRLHMHNSGPTIPNKVTDLLREARDRIPLQPATPPMRNLGLGHHRPKKGAQAHIRGPSQASHNHETSRRVPSQIHTLTAVATLCHFHATTSPSSSPRHLHHHYEQWPSFTTERSNDDNTRDMLGSRADDEPDTATRKPRRRADPVSTMAHRRLANHQPQPKQNPSSTAARRRPVRHRNTNRHHHPSRSHPPLRRTHHHNLSPSPTLPEPPPQTSGTTTTTSGNTATTPRSPPILPPLPHAPNHTTADHQSHPHPRGNQDHQTTQPLPHSP